MKAKFTRVPSMFPCYIGLVSPSLTGRANAVQLAIKVCFSLFYVDLTQSISATDIW